MGDLLGVTAAEKSTTMNSFMGTGLCLLAVCILCTAAEKDVDALVPETAFAGDAPPMDAALVQEIATEHKSAAKEHKKKGVFVPTFRTLKENQKAQEARNKKWAKVNSASYNKKAFAASQKKINKMNHAAEKARQNMIHAKESMQKKYANDDPEDSRTYATGSAAKRAKWLIDGNTGPESGSYGASGVVGKMKWYGNGVISKDAKVSKGGHFFLGRRRRRIGAGFGRRRRGTRDKIKVKVTKKKIDESVKHKDLLKKGLLKKKWKNPDRLTVADKTELGKSGAGSKAKVDPTGHFDEKTDARIMGNKAAEALAGRNKKAKGKAKAKAKAKAEKKAKHKAKAKAMAKGKKKPAEARDCAHVCIKGKCDTPADAKKKECAACVKCHDTHSLKAGEESHDQDDGK